jgi:hypothetical protein
LLLRRHIGTSLFKVLERFSKHLASLSNLEGSLEFSGNAADFLSCPGAGSEQNVAKSARAIGFINAAVILCLMFEFFAL